VVEQLDRALHPTRHWIYLGAAASLILGSGLVTASLLVEREPLCDRAAAEAERAWGSARREAVSAALRATDRDFSARTVQQVTERLDAHAQAWTKAHASACEGTEDQATRDAVLLQVACLDRIALETEALTRALAEEPERFVEHATLAVYKLREPTRCLESSQPWVGLGLGPGVRSDTGPMPIFVTLARAEARLNAADDEGIEDAVAALELARSMGEPTYEAEALLLRGMFWTRVGRWSEAERDLVAANDVAEQYGAWEVAVRARTELVFVVGFRQRRFGEARVWSGLAQSALERAGAGGLVEVRLLNAQGLVLAEQDRAASARVPLEQALKLARASLDPNHPGLAATLENLGRLELLEGRRDEARAQVLEAYRIRASTLGPTHPDTVRTKELLALVQP
jgi:tetratricopeptide (TPR) repeat protein